jgi:UDP-3-O-acyl-N-acetylglucosamine deacetylase
MSFIKFQRTISNNTSCVGVGLHTGVESKITFKPAPDNFGIRFKRMDVEGCPEIRADIDHVIDISRGTTQAANACSTVWILTPFSAMVVPLEISIT